MAYALFSAALLIGISAVSAVGSSAHINSAPTPNIGDVEFSQLLVLLSQYFTEVRHDVLELKTLLNLANARISHLELEFQELPENLRKNITFIEDKLSRINTTVDGVIQSVELVSSNLNSQLSRVSSNVTSLQSNVDGVANRVSTLERTSVSDIKLGPFEKIWVWKNAGYVDQYSYVLTQLNNWNKDDFPDEVGRRQILKKVAGNWVNIG